MERAALGLLRVVGRLLAYKEGADGLVDSLQLLTKMRTQLAWDMAPKVTAQVLSAAGFDSDLAASHAHGEGASAYAASALPLT